MTITTHRMPKTMVVFCCREKVRFTPAPRCRWHRARRHGFRGGRALCHRHRGAGGIELAVTDFEEDALERSSRRSGDRRARGNLERAVVAGTVKTTAGEIGDDGAAQVRALLVVRVIRLWTGSDHDAVVV